MKRQLGFGSVGVVAIVISILTIGGVGYVLFRNSSETKSAATTATQTTSDAQAPVTEPAIDPAAPQQPAENQYSNPKYGFSFSYPKEWKVEVRDPKLTYIEPVELSLALMDNKVEGESIVATVAVSDLALSEVGPSGDGEKASQFRQQLAVRGKQAVKYTIPQTVLVDREMYYIAAAGKTYWIQTFNEEVNVKQDKEYAAKFNKLVDSLELP